MHETWKNFLSHIWVIIADAILIHTNNVSNSMIVYSPFMYSHDLFKVDKAESTTGRFYNAREE